VASPTCCFCSFAMHAMFCKMIVVLRNRRVALWMRRCGGAHVPPAVAEQLLLLWRLLWRRTACAELEKIREARLKELKEKTMQKREQLSLGHGEFR
jgi:hypothetical protein